MLCDKAFFDQLHTLTLTKQSTEHTTQFPTSSFTPIIKMFSFKNLISAMAFASLAIAVHAVPTKDTLTQEVASALGVTVEDLTTLQNTADPKDLDVNIWTNPLGQGPVDTTLWDDDIKATFMQEMKAEVAKALEATPLSKREIGSDSAAARAQVAAAIANAQASRDASNRRQLLQCNSGTQKGCTICAVLCSGAWVSATAICGGAALGAAVGSGGTLSLPASVSLAGCLGLATTGYGACIVKCIG